MPAKQFARYLAPNLITTLNLLFGMLSLAAAFEGRHVEAAWWILYAVCTDRIDGLVARLVKGSSELGVQLDSLADFLNFGIAPPVLIFTSLGHTAELPFAAGGGRVLLMLACAVWVLGATFRLARFNVTTGEEVASGRPKLFFGIPTTLAAGTVVVWYLALAKYAVPGSPLFAGEFGGPRVFGHLATPDGVWRYVPLALVVGGLLMASNLRMPKLGKMRSRAFTVFVLVNVLGGYALCFARLLPEILVWMPSAWLVMFLVWGQVSREARAIRPPRIFPRE